MASLAGLKGVRGLKNENFYKKHYHGKTTADRYSLDVISKPHKIPKKPDEENNSYRGNRRSSHRESYSNTISGIPPEEIAGGKRRTKRKRSNPKKLKRKSYRKYNARKTTN